MIKEWKTSETVRAYTFRDIGVDQPGEAYWQSYRWMLEQFVNRARGREARQWVGPDDAVNTAKMVDMAYRTAGLTPRPTSEYK